jgi:hypothetical protein
MQRECYSHIMIMRWGVGLGTRGVGGGHVPAPMADTYRARATTSPIQLDVAGAAVASKSPIGVRPSKIPTHSRPPPSLSVKITLWKRKKISSSGCFALKLPLGALATDCTTPIKSASSKKIAPFTISWIRHCDPRFQTRLLLSALAEIGGACFAKRTAHQSLCRPIAYFLVWQVSVIVALRTSDVLRLLCIYYGCRH